ncbi:hypothetical protein [Pseudomonas nunensis]|uniref:Transmembrane protein n=1 Tax=Pseudomonas nunensis TaxID=2961896 RepID=A0ABY5ECI9_9PSED|nr:hypothetical protein [Pseudomonas nunensis]KPN91947.1 hypothetical protein AL066_17000 [Pseudomonas nunensis]MCL5229333.1 hypothetical protein [Pseudomonas nunensis]UTO12163.1 hypothetical protein NK667_18500 [Pseudomonas nunensis]
MDETISYLKDRFKEEQARFDQIENKSAKFFTAVSILIAGLSALASMKNGVLFQLRSPLSVITFLAFAIAAAAIACAWAHALSSLSIKAYPNLPSNRETAEYLKAVDEEGYQVHLYNCYTDTLELLKASIDEKSKPLSLAYGEITIAAGAFALLVVFIIIRELTA